MSAARVAAGFSDRVMTRFALVVYGISIGLLIWTVIDGWGVLFGDVESAREALWPVRGAAGAWVFLIPVMVIGFLFCPYFDLTFHRAYQAVGGGISGRLVFLMFGIFFAVMILFTAVYAVTGLVTWVVVVQLVLQGWLTTALHWREIIEFGVRSEDVCVGEADSSLGRVPGGVLVWLPLLAVLLGPVPQPWMDYRDWLVFYGLLFPIYALLGEVRRRRGRVEARGMTVLSLKPVVEPLGIAQHRQYVIVARHDERLEPLIEPDGGIVTQRPRLAQLAARRKHTLLSQRPGSGGVADCGLCVAS